MQFTSTFKFSEVCMDKLHDGLVPAIIQDYYSREVLMLGYMNEESFNKTCKDGKVTFFSRTEQKIWQKGETSGNYLHVVDIQLDCDKDTILIQAIPDGPTCHLGTDTCFGNSNHKGFIGKLIRKIKDIHILFPSNGYTIQLLSSDISKINSKVIEEANEVVVESKNNNHPGLIYEISDLVYHLLVLMERHNITKEDIEKELFKRTK